MGQGAGGAAMVGPAHLLAKHQERVQADSAARPSSAGVPAAAAVRTFQMAYISANQVVGGSAVMFSAAAQYARQQVSSQ